MGSRNPGGGPASESFAHAFRVALDERSMSLSALQKLLEAHGNPVSRTTLGYWRSGQRNPEGAVSLAAVADIERSLGMGEHALTRLLGPSRRTGRISPARVAGGRAVNIALDECAAALALDKTGGIRDISTRIVADVDERGRVRSIRNQAVLQCVSGTVTEFPYFEVSDLPMSAPPEFTAITGCRFGRSHLHESGRVFGIVMQPELPLETADTVVIEWSAAFPDEGYPRVRMIEHAVFRRSRDLLLVVRFPEGTVPDWCEEIEQDADDHVLVRRRIPSSPTVHVTRSGFGPGRVRLSWGYDSPTPTPEATAPRLSGHAG